MSDSLIDAVVPQDVTPPPTQSKEGMTTQTQPTDNQQSANDWYFTEGVKGQGDKPDYLLPKFKSLADQAKSYTELEKKLGGFKGAPENYELKIPDELKDKVTFNTEDPLYQKFAEAAKAANMSNETFNQLLAVYGGTIAEQAQINKTEELKKLGDKAHERVGNLNRWAQNNLSPEDYKLFHGMAKDANTVMLFEKLRGLTVENAAPTAGAVSSGIPTRAEIDKLIADPRYATDKDYREEVRKKIQIFTGER